MDATTLDERRRDVADLQKATKARHLLPRQSPEWWDRIREEDRLIARIRGWASPTRENDDA